MGREVNEGYIHDLERKIEEGMGDVIQLKRARNLALNISVRIPPEILGCIFCCSVSRKRDHHHHSMRPQGGSYNFVLVCHHWFEVASHTAELWSYWGDTLEQWLRWSKYPGTHPVDLTLNGYKYAGPLPTLFNQTLQSLWGPLRERAGRDAIRSINFRADVSTTAILSALTLDDEGVQCSSVESISLQYADISEFFAHNRLPKLWYLDLRTGVETSSWEPLGLHTTALTTLIITIGDKKSNPTTTQLLSVLSSNPRLRSLTLSRYGIPQDNGDGSTSTVPLRSLEKLDIKGTFRSTFQLLGRLDYPSRMTKMTLGVFRCEIEDISGTLGPYVRNHIERDGRFRDGLGISVASSPDALSLKVGTVHDVEGQIQTVKFATFVATPRWVIPDDDEARICGDLLEHIPLGHVVYFSGDLDMGVFGRIITAMPRIRELRLINVHLDDGFLRPDPEEPLSKERPLPLLRCIDLEAATLGLKRWDPLLSYLRVNEASGGKVIALTISGGEEHMCRHVEEEIEGFVEELSLDYMVDICPFGKCGLEKIRDDE